MHEFFIPQLVRLSPEEVQVALTDVLSLYLAFSGFSTQAIDVFGVCCNLFSVQVLDYLLL